jgi:hypothetical protein
MTVVVTERLILRMIWEKVEGGNKRSTNDCGNCH